MGIETSSSQADPLPSVLSAPLPPLVLPAKIRPVPTRALRRERLDRAMEGVWEHRLTLVCGPAGSGKTTLLTQFVTASEAPAAWYCAEGGDASVAALLAHLHKAFEVAVADVDGPWDSVEGAALALERCLTGPTVLAIDDLHTLAASPAELALERLLNYAPRWLHVAVASRRAPEWNLSRLRVSRDLLEVGSDDLRFRVWEVEQLFRDFWDEPLPPADVAQLARDLQGWAAGLQLFHLATRDKSMGDRRRALARLPARSGLIREYLTRNVLDELPSELKDFLLDTCVLGRLSGPLCDRLREKHGSSALLEELERRQMFVVRLSGDGEYRYHEVLRSHLETELVHLVGESQVRDRFAAAGSLMRSEGLSGDALRAFCRADEWESVDQLLKENGAELAGNPGTWLDMVPRWLLDEDPWVMLGTARRHRAAGSWSAAVAMYGRALQASGPSVQRQICERERLALEAWLQHDRSAPADWTGRCRSAVRGHPLASPQTQGRDDGDALGEGFVVLLAGRCGEAATILGDIIDDPDASAGATVGALFGLAVIGAVSTVPVGQPIAALGDHAEVFSSRWLWLLGRAAAAMSGRPADLQSAGEIARDLDREGDAWGSALADLFSCIGGIWSGAAPVPELQRLSERLAALGAGTIEVWCRSWLALALARSGAEAARAVALDAERRAEDLGVPGARAVALSVAADLGSSTGFRELADTIASDCQLVLPRLQEPAPGSPVVAVAVAQTHHAGAPTISVRCLGGFRLECRGALVDLSEVRPRVRSVLRLLAIHPGQPVHVETLVASLWPDVGEAAGRRNLQVAISTLRRLLETAESGSSGMSIDREGHAYRLVLPDDALIDLDELDRALRDARRALQAGDSPATANALERALTAYGGDLFPEEGPADWVSERRQSLEARAAEAAHRLAQLRMELGDPEAAAAACERGLEIDRYHDGLWRCLTAAHESLGDLAAARRSRSSYDEVLRELGVVTEEIR